MSDNPLTMFSLEGRTAVLIGAGSGIGREAARVFAGAGARVVIADAEAERLAEAKEFIGGRPGQVETVTLDVRDRDALERLAQDQSAKGSLTKAAVNMLTRTLALELAPLGVRVNAIAPGFIDTPLIQYRYGTDLAAKEALLADRAAAIPLRRVGVPADVAYAMLYLASDASSFMTGQIIRPNGGWVMP